VGIVTVDERNPEILLALNAARFRQAWVRKAVNAASSISPEAIGNGRWWIAPRPRMVRPSVVQAYPTPQRTRPGDAGGGLHGSLVRLGDLVLHRNQQMWRKKRLQRGRPQGRGDGVLGSPHHGQNIPRRPQSRNRGLLIGLGAIIVGLVGQWHELLLQFVEQLFLDYRLQCDRLRIRRSPCSAQKAGSAALASLSKFLACTRVANARPAAIRRRTYRTK
jgi:hypothetical protein